MIASLVIAFRIIRTAQILPGTGRCPNGAEGSQAGHEAVQVESWDPSVASRHLPVPGRS